MGKTVDPTGLTFTVTKVDGTTASVSPQTLTPTTWGDTVGTQTCTFTYTDGYDSVSCVVEATVQAIEVVSIAVSGTPVRQHSFSPLDATGLTVTATYNDASTADVTSSATWTASQTNIGYWDAVLQYDDQHSTWDYDSNNYHLIASYEGETANSSDFKLHGKIDNGGTIEIPNRANEYETYNFMDTASEAADPWDGSTGGWLLEGASVGDLVWMTFTKSQWDNDTPVDMTAFGNTAVAFGSDISGSSTNPPFGLYGNVGQRLFCTSILGTGTDNTEYVLVEGKLNHAVTAGGEGTVQKSYFDFTGDNAAYVFNISLVTPPTP